MTDAEKKKALVNQYQLEQIIAKLETRLASATPTPVIYSDDDEEPEEVNVDIKPFTESGATQTSFIYIEGYTYLYGSASTVRELYSASNVTYAVFKVLDLDKYFRFTVTVDSTATDMARYTYLDEFDSETLPYAIAKNFEMSKYALVHRIVAGWADSFVKTRVGVFLDPGGAMCKSYYYWEETDTSGIIGTAGQYIAILDFACVNIYVYKLESSDSRFHFMLVYPPGATGTILTTYNALYEKLSGGKTYTAGDGIVISDSNSISADTASTDDVNDNIGF